LNCQGKVNGVIAGKVAVTTTLHEGKFIHNGQKIDVEYNCDGFKVTGSFVFSGHFNYKSKPTKVITKRPSGIIISCEVFADKLVGLFYPYGGSVKPISGMIELSSPLAGEATI